MYVRLKKPCREVEKAFQKLPGGPIAECPIPDCVCCGEVWGYMGSFLISGVWKHEFRHKHFEGKSRKVLMIPATDGWEPVSS